MIFPKLTVLFSIAIVTLFLVFGANPEPLVWTQGSVLSWRWLSGHFVHISAAHLLWNLVAFVLLAWIIEQHNRKHLLISLAIGVTTINFYLATGYSMFAYAGLSGVLNTLLVVALFHLCRSDTYRNAAMLTLIGSMIKIVIEMNSGTSLVSQLSWPPVPQAHLVGWISGIAMCLVIGLGESVRRHLLESYRI